MPEELNTLVTQQQVKSFEEQGFIVIDEMLSKQELDRYGSAVDEAVQRRSRWDTRKIEDRSRYEQSFRQCINLWEDSPAVRPLTFHPRIGEAAATLLRAQVVRIWHDQALYKEAGGRETAPHLDHDYWAIEEPRTITAWIPFDGSTRTMGAMGYVPGSHRFDVKTFANIFTAEGFDLENGQEARGVQPEFVEVPPGSVAFHHGRTIHLAKSNRSDRTRRVHTMIFFADGCTRRNAKHPSVDRTGVPIGAVIDSPVTPIAWPLVDGLPHPPPLPDPPLPAWPGWQGRRSPPDGN
jgi:ectoine hydroxylase-related dioxygenase (phytanoyl-CoA dioxygenase family)